MLFFNGFSYKAKLISIYISFTVLGILLTLVAINNASREQRLLEQISFTHQLLKNTSSLNNLLKALPHFKVIPLDNNTPDAVNFDNCTVRLADSINISPGSQGGLIQGDSCSASWNLFTPDSNQTPALILQPFDNDNIDTILSAYRNRIIIPVIFFIWITVWGSLMLGNLVKRLQTQKNEVEHIALHDALTSLPNRNYFSDKVNEQINYSRRKNKSFTLAVIDLNKFKQVNDELGHQFGDSILVEVAQRLSETIREYDVAARLGGDEFVLLLVDADCHSTFSLLERIHERLVEPYHVKDRVLQIGASIGAADYPEHATSYEQLFQNADAAMYQAKSAGGGITLYLKR